MSNLRYNSAPSRRDGLVTFVQEQGYCSVAELSQRFGVSEMTIRRDVSRLADEGKLKSFRGGASSVLPQDLRGSDYQHRSAMQSDVKWRVAEEALRHLPPSGIVAIDAGTSGEALARQFPDDRDLRVVTPSLPVINTLAHKERIEVISLGGAFHPETQSFAGSYSVNMLGNFQIERLFLTVSAMNTRGVFCTTDFDAVTKRALIEVATKVVLLADSSKFERTAMVKVCPWDDIDVLVIDSGLSGGWREFIADKVPETQLVDEPHSSPDTNRRSGVNRGSQ